MNKNLILILFSVFLAFSVIILKNSIAESSMLALVNSIDYSKGEIIITTKGRGDTVKMGDLLYIKIDGNIVLLRAVFPMMTITKCKAEGKNSYLWRKAEKGFPVYRYEAGIEKINLSAGEQEGLKIINGIELLKIPSGEFIMGSSDYDKESGIDEKPQHQVKISSFYMSRHEITQKQYSDITGINPSAFKNNINNPVEQVSWEDAVNFCNKLSIKTGFKPYYLIKNNTVTTIAGSNGFRLPTEAEWEYASRGGATTIFHWGDKINKDYAWYEDNSSSTTHPAGTKKPNAFGLYDMNGNVSEWCFDLYDDAFYFTSPVLNPVNILNGSARVIRGGSRYSPVSKIRSAARNYYYPDSSSNVIGFRISKSN